MQKVLATAVLFLALASPAAAADITGVWLAAQARQAHIEIARCGDGYCGRVLSATRPKTNPEYLDVHNKNPALRARKLIGAVLIEGFKGGPEKFTGGRIYNPGDGNTYHGSITVIDNDHLELKGCALLILCKSQVWTRLQ